MNIFKLKITIRNFRKNGVLSFAKLLSLSLAFFVVLIISGYVYYETSFDKFISDHNKIYRCLMQGRLNKEIVDYAVTSSAQAKAIANEIPEIAEAIRIKPKGNTTINYKYNKYDGGNLYYVDSAFFRFFCINLTSNLDNPLASKKNVVIAKSVAKNIFGNANNAIGKVVELRDQDCVITGVFDDLPKNSHLNVKLIQSIEKLKPSNTKWESQNYFTYFKTNCSEIDKDELNFKISKIVYSHHNNEIDGANAQNWQDLRWEDNFYIFYNAEPLTDIHFSNHKFDFAETSNRIYVYGAIFLAIIVLVISSINFINLTISNFSTRLKEVGILKTNGAFKKHIISQYLFEINLFFITSFIIALSLYFPFNKQILLYFGFHIYLSNAIILKIVSFVFLALLFLNLLVSIIPVTIVAKLNIINLLSSKKSMNNHHWWNSGFIIAQFILSGLIILSSIVVQRQINFIVAKDRGYDTENVIMFNLRNVSSENRNSFIEKLKSHAPVLSVSTSSQLFGNDIGMNGAHFEATEEPDNFFHTTLMFVDDEFLKTFNFKIKEGRFFDKERKSDFDAAIINESAVKEYNGAGSLLGKKLITDNKHYEIIGIIKDFNFRSLHHKIEPIVITRINKKGNVYVKYENAQTDNVLQIINKLWDEFNVSSPFNYTFHDDVIADHYIKDNQAKKLLFTISIISILIACVGLYAISYFVTLRKTKEIGIRKVNGAKVISIILQLNKNFIQSIIISFLIVIPFSYYIMNMWLDNFAYKISISWWIFSLTGLIILVFALLSISFQSWKIASQNPVEALRYE